MPSEVVNQLGAVSLAIADRVRVATESASNHSGAGPAAIVALHEFLHEAGPSDLQEVLQLTLSGAVRLVDRLEADGLLKRNAGRDGRSMRLGLTAKGKAAARAILARREATLRQLLEHLSDQEREVLGRMNVKLLAALALAGASASRTCRLCDTTACGHHNGRCPVTNALRQVAEAGAPKDPA